MISFLKEQHKGFFSREKRPAKLFLKLRIKVARRFRPFRRVMTDENNVDPLSFSAHKTILGIFN
jgi:hypothetical protein